MRIVGCAALLIALGSISGCESFPRLTAETCGNSVKEEGEDCDNFPNGEGTICRKPGTEGECRFDCTPAVAPGVTGACPAGYVCSPSDYICRVPTGVFVAGPSVIDEGIQKILLGDFDGDGRKDALTVSAAEQRVHFFDALGARVTSVDVPGALQKPGVGRLTGEGDRTDDFTNIAGIGVSVLRGQENRTIAPTQYEIIRIEEQSRYSLFTIEADSTQDGHEIMGLFQKANETTVTVQTLNLEGSVADPPPLTILNIPGPLTGEAAVGNLFDLPFQECEEAVFGFANADHVTVFSPCAIDPTLKEQKIYLAGMGKITSAPHLADMNGDGALDIVFGGFAGHQNKKLMNETCHFVGVAYNIGQGGFASDPAAASPDSKAALAFDYFVDEMADSCAVPAGDLMGHAFLRPIAAGDVNGDGVGDYVDPLGIHVSIPIQGTKKISRFGEPIRLIDSIWTSAVVADFTADGILDVIAGSEIVPGMDFFQGTGDPEVPLNYAQIPSEYPIASLKTGYFDADAVRDAVFAERKLLDPSLPPNASGDELAVVFGRAFAPPEPPTRFGRMSRIQQVLVANIPVTIPLEDAMSDVLVLTGQEAPIPIDIPKSMPVEPPPVETKSLLVLPGNGERQLLSPYLLLAPHFGIPLLTAVGQFDGVAEGPDDVAVFGGGPDQQADLWLLPVMDDGQFAPPWKGGAGPVTTVSTVPLETLVPPGVVLNTRLLDYVVANIDAKGADELVVFAPTDNIEQPELYRLVAKTGQVDEGAGAFPGWIVEPAEKLEGLSLPLHIESADINGDTLEDVVGVFFEKPEKKLALPPAQIAVYLSLAGGGFKRVGINIPIHIDPRPDYSFNDRPWTVAAVNVDEDREKEVAIFSTTRMYIAHFDPATETFGDPAEIITVGGTASAAGDVTGDGIDDIVVSDGTNLRVLVAQSP
jgi:hypothetical protein